MADDFEKKRISELDPVSNNPTTHIPLLNNGDLLEVAEPQENGTIYISKNMSIYQIKEYLFASIYPVGSLYMSIQNVDPGSIFGGQWELYAQGRTLIGVDRDKSKGDQYNQKFGFANRTGGAKTVTLNTNNMPQHVHNVESISTLLDMGAVEFGIRHSLAQESGKTDPSVKMDKTYGTVTSPTKDVTKTWSTGTYIKNQPSDSDQKGDSVKIKLPGMTTTVEVGNAGKPSPDPINILPPYVTCYIWLKTGDTIDL